MKPLSEAILVVCGIVRNAERGLKRNIPIIKTLCGMAKDYHVVVYENDSKDNTKSLLESWYLMDTDRIHISMNDMGSSASIPNRKKNFI